MRIKSRFRDFYDSAQQYVQGDSTWYRRNLLIVPNAEDLHVHGPFGPEIVRVGFCGIVYSGIRWWWSERVHPRQSKWVDRWEYSWNYLEYLESRMSRTSYLREHDLRCHKHLFGADGGDGFVENNAPVFIHHPLPRRPTTRPTEESPIWWTKDRPSAIFYHTQNPADYPIERDRGKRYTLQHVGFDRVFDANTAYMQVESYVNGVLGREHKVVPEPDDETKIGSHGFDKASFRRHKKR